MNIDIWVIYLGTVLAFMSTPGPSHILMLSNSIGNGFKKSTATAAGDLSANFLQMLAASIGLASILQESQQYFFLVKWAGVAYLAYLGIKLITSKKSNLNLTSTNKRSTKSLYWQGFLTSAANPKAVIFFAALFPQFIVATEPLIPQFIVLSITYLAIDGLFLCFYGKFAEFFAKKLVTSIGQYFNQLSGSLFIGAAILLGLIDVEKH
ncbi:MAG: LysE family translocator [Alcanivoracaceae bacterium]|nr:LysE family translocator [Alcanivoracaceae bacterium]